MVHILTRMSSSNGKSTTSFRFTPENHTEKILQSITEMRNGEILIDVILLVEGRQFPAHKNVLAACSEYFKAMFSFGHSETTVKVEGVTAKAMDLILDFMYQGQIEITEDNLEDILVASRLLLLESVTQACCKFTQDRINVNNCWGIRNIADKYSLEKLFDKAHTFIEDNFSEAKGSTEFLTLPVEPLTELMADDELNIREDELASAVLKWVEHDLEGRYQFLETLFKHLRIGYISEVYIRSLVEKNFIVSNHTYLIDLIMAVRSQADSPTLDSLLHREELTKMNTPRKWQRIVPILTAVGGTQTLFYNTEEKIWVSLAPITTRHCPGLASIKSEMFLVGGSREWIRLADCLRFSPEQNTWEDMALMNVARSNIGLVVLEGCLYSVGGYDGNTPTRYVERYDPAKNEWSFVSSMNDTRDGACVVADDNNIFAITGFAGQSYLSTIDVYDPSKNVWTTQGYTPITNPRQDAMSACVDGKVYVIGGYCNDNYMSSGEVYDIEDNVWMPIAPMSVERNKAGCAAFNRKIYICGGWEGSGKVLNSVEVYDTETDCWTALPPLPTPSAMRATFVYFPRKQVDKLTKKTRQKKQKQIHAVITSAQ